MTGRHPLAQAAAELADVLRRLDLAWEATEEAIDDDDQRDALHVALAKNYPLKVDLTEQVALADQWAEHVEQLMDEPPSVLELVAEEMQQDVQAVKAECERRGEPAADDAYRQWQNGGLGGQIGRFGGTFTPTVASQMAALLAAVDRGDTDQIRQTADAMARTYREARRNSRT